MSDSRIRFKENKGHTVLYNSLVRDCRLSLKTIGLLAVMRSLANTEWDFSVSGMAKFCQVGKDSIRNSLKELEEAGYLIRERTHNDDGTFGGNEYVIFDTSRKPLEDAAPDEKMADLNHRRKKPTMAKAQRRLDPTPDNPTQIKEITQVKENNTPLPPAAERVRFAENVTMTNGEHERLLATYGTADTARLIEILDNYKGSTGKKYKNDYRAILSWCVDRLRERDGKPQGRDIRYVE